MEALDELAVREQRLVYLVTYSRADLEKVPTRESFAEAVTLAWMQTTVVKDTLEKEAIERNITKESFEEFNTRVLRTLGDVDPAIIDRAIDSMPTRIKLIIKGNGYRTKY